MRRTQRFPFPLPSRKPDTPQQPSSPPRKPSNNSGNMDDSNSKAHKILGTSDTSSIKTNKSKKWNSKKSVSTKQSYISITVSEVSSAKTDKSKLPVENQSNPGAPRRQSSGDSELQQRPSSSALGERYEGRESTSEGPEPARSQQLSTFDSSSSLHSFYDPAKSPLSISQQTSESSTRDYALRKGCPPVVESKRATLNGRRNIPQKSSPSKPLRRRPPKIDLSVLFPRPKNSSGALLSPRRLTDSPSPVSETSIPALNPKLEALTGISSTKPSKSDRQKMFSWDPKSQNRMKSIEPPPAIKNWFDTFREVHSDDELPDDSQSLAVSKPVLHQLEHHHSRNVSDDTIRAKSPPSFLNSFEGLSNDEQPQRANSRSPHHGKRTSDDHKRPPSVASRPSAISKKSKHSQIAQANLEEESMLCLSSSSDDENETDRIVSRSKSNDNRLSIATSTYDAETVESCLAETASSIQSSPKIRTPRSSMKSSSSHGKRPKHPIPPRFSSASAVTVSIARPKRSSSLPQNASVTAVSKSAPTAGSVKSQPTNHLSRLPQATYVPEFTHPKSQSQSESENELLSLPRSTRNFRRSSRQSRIMSVTREEESLLEAMRHRRATMRQSLFEEGYKAGVHHDIETGLDDPTRPKTSYNESQSSFLRLSQDFHSVAFRPQKSENRASIHGNVSLLDPTLPTTEEDSSEKKSGQESSQSNRGSLLFGPVSSDAAPSPSTSRASPITPTTAHSANQTSSLAGDRYSKELSNPQVPPTDELADRRRSRTRTLSSGVLVLDGADVPEGERTSVLCLDGLTGPDGSRRLSMQEKTTMLVDDGWPIWAVKGWGPENGGLAVI